MNNKWERMLTGGHQGDDCNEQRESACRAAHQVARHIVVLHSTPRHPLALLDLLQQQQRPL